MSITDDQIDRIAKHALEDPTKLHRFNAEKYGPPLHVETPDDLSAAIKTAARSAETRHAKRAEGGYLVHHDAMNLTVQADGLGGGTAFREKGGKGFRRVVKQENKLSKDRGLPSAEVMNGPVPSMDRNREKTVAHEASSVPSTQAHDRTRVREAANARKQSRQPRR